MNSSKSFSEIFVEYGDRLEFNSMVDLSAKDDSLLTYGGISFSSTVSNWISRPVLVSKVKFSRLCDRSRVDLTSGRIFVTMPANDIGAEFFLLTLLLWSILRWHFRQFLA